MCRISVVIAVHNGSKHIQAQLDSIFNQTVRPYEVIIVDDASEDNTIEVVHTMLEGVRGIRVRTYSLKQNVGYIYSFEYGLKHALGDYIALSDQDDIWLPHKLQKLLDAIQIAPREKPALAFSDVSVVDKDLKVIYGSYQKLQKFYPQRMIENSKKFFFINIISGMCMLINRALLEKALPFPKAAIAHDWWLGLVCSQAGIIVYVDEPMVLYRQHGNNALGAEIYHDLLWFNVIRNNLFNKVVLRNYIFVQLRMELLYYREHICKRSKQLESLAQVEDNLEKKRQLLKIADRMSQRGFINAMLLAVQGLFPVAWQRKLFCFVALLKN